MKSKAGIRAPVFQIKCSGCGVNGWLIPQGMPIGWTVSRKPDFLDAYLCNNCSVK